jgi:hypothetical protein
MLLQLYVMTCIADAVMFPLGIFVHSQLGLIDGKENDWYTLLIAVVRLSIFNFG